jgi:hypothetical protein
MKMTNKKVEQLFNETIDRLKDKYTLTISQRKDAIRELIYDNLTEKTKKKTAFVEELMKEMYIGLNETTYVLIDENCEFASANFKSNRIRINPRKINELTKDAGFISIYNRERHFIDRNCITQEDMIIWIACHEYAHTLELKPAKSTHTISFFKLVEELYLSIQ